MPTILLDDRVVIVVNGTDAVAFLQNLITTDLDALPSGKAMPGALLTPQGKLLFDFLVSRRPDGGFRLDCRREFAPDLVKRLMLYRLRAKVEFSISDQELVGVRWDTESGSSEADSGVEWFDDARFLSGPSVQRGYGAAPFAGGSRERWEAMRIAAGVAEMGLDFPPSDAFPHDVLLDQNGGVGLRKGCYVGQEVVSRMHHRGTARRRIVLVEGDEGLPPSGTAITAAGRAAGAMGSSLGATGLALVRIDKVGEARASGEALLAGSVAVSLSIPAGVRFDWPAAGAGDED